MFATALAAFLAGPQVARACRVIELDFTPSDNLQIVAWLENASGEMVATLFITEETGRYGLGNRPGIMEFNSEFLWPYGRRESVFPVWAHKRGVTYPRIVFQDGLDRDLSHAFSKSSTENHYCRPFRTDETARDKSIDTGTCATLAFTDKGRFATDGKTSLYPPRRDVVFQPGTDHPDVQTYKNLNDLDAVSRATPPGNELYTHALVVPGGIPDGNYTVWMEVGKEFDPNISYQFASPQLQAYGDYGVAYRGQPSVLWKVPIVIDGTTRQAQAADYAGYGDPDGIDGRIREPDATITANQDGSGARRLLLSMGEGGMYRLAVRSLPSESGQAPEAPATMNVAAVEPDRASITFIEPSDPNTGGAVKAFEVHVSAGTPLTPDNLTPATLRSTTKIVPKGPGSIQTVEIGDLDAETHYWVAIRAQDDCLDSGPPAIVELVTPRRELPEVSACFVATAAFGSPMMAEVSLLRRFRDRMLRRVVIGEMFVETYYTFGPALAGVIRPSPTLRQVARSGLAPLVEWVRGMAP